MVAEVASNGNALTQYRQLDPALAVGGIPVAQCLELAAVCGDPKELPPDDRYEWAWLALETSLAMANSNDPGTGRRFLPGKVQGATLQAQAAFRSVIRDPETSLATGVRAQVALAGAPTYHEARNWGTTTVRSPQFKPYATALINAAKALVTSPEVSPQEAELADVLATIGIATEIAHEQGYFLLAAPRQPWHINSVNRHSGRSYNIAIGNEGPDEVIVVPPEVLTTSQLQASGEQFPTLAAFARQKVGFGTKGVSPPSGRKFIAKRNFSPEEIELLQVGDQILARFNQQRRKVDSVVVRATGNLALANGETGEASVNPDLRPELSWYQSQLADDISSMPRKTFLTHLESLTTAARNGELNPVELHTLAWMHVDNGRLLARQAAAKARAAESEQSQIVRSAPAKAEQHRRDAAQLKATSQELLEQAQTQFDAADESLSTALAHIAPEHASDTYEVQLSKEAIPVYKALFTPSSPEKLQSTVDAYLHRVGLLAPQLRDAVKKVRRDTQQIDSLLATSARAALILLLTGATDEAARHLVLPTGARSGGRWGKADALIFPFDYSTEGYDAANPLTLNLLADDQITFDRQHIKLGRKAIVRANSDIIPLMVRLGSVVRTFKGGRNKRQSHGPAMNALALRLSDAVADATG